MQNATRHPHILRHRAIHAVAKTLARVVEVVETATRHRVVLGNDRGGLGDNAVAFLPAFHVLADFDDVAAEFVTKHDRIIHRPGMIRRPLVQVRAAHAHIGDLQQHVLGTDGGFLDFTDFDRAFSRRVVDDSSGFHGAKR